MSNQNNCETCDYKKLNGNREKGHCYMFRDEPTEVCMQRTVRQVKPLRRTSTDIFERVAESVIAGYKTQR